MYGGGNNAALAPGGVYTMPGGVGVVGGGSMIQSDNVKIVINREEKVVNHLTKEVNNNLNLMFYDFNDYGGQVKNNRLAS